MFRLLFMIEFNKFDAERRCVSTMEDVTAFMNKWFPIDDWPRWQKPDKWSEVVMQAERNRELAKAATGRAWAPIMIPYALEPDARYQYYKTMAMFDNIRFPSLKGEPRELGISKWHLECNFCLITTWTEGSIYCPICGKEMVYSWSGD
jgi:hypothetical protein